jgi:methionine-gamma-lyase
MSSRGFATRAIHQADLSGTPDGTPVVTPIHQTANWAFSTSEAYADVINEAEPGYVYTRLGNPTIATFERVIADLEGGEAALCLASGMAAIHITVIGTCGAGDHVVCSGAVYGGVRGLLGSVLPRCGIETSFADATDPAAVERAIRPTTRLIYAETIGNPTLDVPDLPRLAEIAHLRGAALAVDNTFATPYYCNPLDHGVDLVIHSATKYLGGHADVIAGAVIGDQERIEALRHLTIDVGGIAAPLTAWLLLRGLKTLALRMERHTASAIEVARFLENHPAVERVLYPGLPSHPHRDVAQRLLGGAGGMIGFEVQGGVEGGRCFQDALKLCVRAASLGECHTLVTHPASTTHRQYGAEERRAVGITDGFIRLSVGLEDAEDIIADLVQALDRVSAGSGP